jgi:putative transposase
VTQTTSAADDSTAAQRLVDVLSPATIDSLIKAANSSATPLDGVDGLLNQITKTVVDRALEAEMTGHLGYEVGDPAGRGRAIPGTGRQRKRCRRSTAR